ncbi:hypothetical protein TSMEX_007897 [Taenia solium]|eukprot:TsM_000938300 transcript=TsM_000938300 gene=TsM_000938300
MAECRQSLRKMRRNPPRPMPSHLVKKCDMIRDLAVDQLRTHYFMLISPEESSNNLCREVVDLRKQLNEIGPTKSMLEMTIQMRELKAEKGGRSRIPNEM